MMTRSWACLDEARPGIELGGSARDVPLVAWQPPVRYLTVQDLNESYAMSATARLDLRLSAKDRERIDRAAALAGLPLAAFVRTAVLREAGRPCAAVSPGIHAPAASERWRAAAVDVVL